MIDTKNKLGFTRYKGTLIEIVSVNEVKALRKVYNSFEAAKSGIDAAFSNWNVFGKISSAIKKATI